MAEMSYDFQCIGGEGDAQGLNSLRVGILELQKDGNYITKDYTKKIPSTKSRYFRC